jgi:hypothetical protein
VVESAGDSEVDVLKGGLLSEFGLAQPDAQLVALPMRHFAIDEKAKPLLEAKRIVKCVLALLLKGLGHSEES